jgi:uncharacterized membrane protein YcaP (DUF421 family)
MNQALLQITPFLNWKKFLFGEEDVEFLLEVILRSAIMFIVILISLRVLGRRSVKQLSVFELIVILSLGSAAGDATFYKDVGLLPACLVFVIVVMFYRALIYIIGKSKKVESLLEGKPQYLIRNGRFNLEGFNKEALAYDEFFAELRIRGVSHLGQVDMAIIETNGQMSLFYYPADDVKFGLPILPGDYEDKYEHIPSADIYSCLFCGHTEKLNKGQNKCPVCGNICWVKSKNDRRTI